MKSAVFAVRLLAALSPLASARPASAAPARVESRTFAVQGIVRGFDREHHQVTIAHEAIPGYMPAMTMAFDVHDDREWQRLAAGDVVAFDLVVAGDDAWVAHAQKRGKSSVPLLAPAPPSAHAWAPGDALPDLALVDTAGRTIRTSDFLGEVLVVAFIYTRCPLPTYCPLTNRNFLQTQSLLARLGRGDGWHFLSVSFDPAHDDPDTLAAYARTWEADPRRWTFASAQPAELHAFGDGLGLEFADAGGQITHNLRTVVIDASGRLSHVFRGNTWTPQELAAAVRTALRRSPS